MVLKMQLVTYMGLESVWDEWTKNPWDIFLLDILTCMPWIPNHIHKSSILIICLTLLFSLRVDMLHASTYSFPAFHIDTCLYLILHQIMLSNCFLCFWLMELVESLGEGHHMQPNQSNLHAITKGMWLNDLMPWKERILPSRWTIILLILYF